MAQITKLRPDRDLQCYFHQPSAVAALSGTSDSGFTVSGSFRQQFDWAVIEWRRDNVFEHPELRCLPDGDLSTLHLQYEEERQGCMAMDCNLWPTVDWPYLRIWAADANGDEQEYKIPLRQYATPVEGGFQGAQAVLELGGAVTATDYVELVWEAGDAVPGEYRHATHMMYYNDTLPGVAAELAAAVNGATATTGMTATAQGARITLQYKPQAGANGNRVGVYANVSGAMTETWQPRWRKMSGGTSPTKWRVDLDFSDLQGYTAPDFKELKPVPTNAVRRMRWTWAAEQQPGDFERREFQVVVSNWTATGLGPYQFAGPGSRRIEDDSPALVWAGAWAPSAIGNYSGGSIRLTETENSSVSHAYTASESHTLYLGTRKFANPNTSGAEISVTVDGATQRQSLAYAGIEDSLVRIKLADLDAGNHTVTAQHAGGGAFYFDFFEIVHPTADLPAFPATPDTTLATDWDTEHSIALAPERTAWLLNTLGFTGRANHYIGAMWYYELTRPGQQYAQATVTLSGAPDFGRHTTISVGDADFKHLNLWADSAATVAKALEFVINAGATAVWARAQGETLTIRARAMGTAGNGLSVTADTEYSLNFAAASSGPLAGGADGDVASMPWAQGWRTDTSASPLLNRAARDWHASYFQALKAYGIDAVAAFSMELQHGDPSLDAGLAQRYPDGSPALLNTPALQTNFSPASLAFWQEAYLEMAGLMSAAEITPYLQFGEVQWWYAAAASGMPFYDEFTIAAFQTSQGRAMRTIPSHNADPAAFPEECAFLAALIGQFTDAIIAYVRTGYPDARFESLYPVDTNDTPLNKLINYPASSWTPALLDCLKTENFIYTGNRDLNRARTSIGLPTQLGFSPAQRAHLIGIGDYTAPWRRERRLALADGVRSVVLFALDQFCLIGYETPLKKGLRRTVRMGAD
jgi:hypothetical protein